MISKQKAVIFFTVLVDAIGIGVIIPVLPFYVASFGASALMVTSLFAVFSFCSFFSSPLLGVLSDKYGRRPILIISIFSTSLGWFVFAGAFHSIFLFVGRIIDGLAAGNFSTAQSYLIDISKTPKEKTHNIGLIGAAFGLGFILGPMLGGFLSPISPSFPFWFVGFLAFFNGALAIFLIPETNPVALDRKEKKIKKEIFKEIFSKENLPSFNPLLPVIRAFKRKPLRKNFASWFLFNLAAVSMQVILALYVGAVFGFGPVFIGIAMTIIGIIIVLNQVAFLKHFWLRYFTEKDLELYLLFFFGIGFLFMALPQLPFFILGLIAMTFAQSVLRVVMTSNISNKEKDGNQGELMGIMGSIGSVASIVGPLIAGALFYISPNCPFFMSAIFGFLSFLFLILPLKQNLKKQLIKV